MPCVAEKKTDSLPTLSAVAKKVDVALATVEKWRAEGMPGTPGKWDVVQIFKWYLTRRRSGGNGSLSDELKEAEIRLKTAQAESKEMENSVESGELVKRDEVELWAATALIELRETMMSLPEILATSAPPELKEFVREESDRHVRDTLIAARRRLETNEIAGDEISGTTTED